MTQEQREFSVRRILVPLDAAENSLVALETAAELAALQGAELEGLFVEDIHILQLCEFPFAQEVSQFGSAVRRLSRADLERQLQIQARRIREALARVAERSRVPWRFRVVRGGVPTEVLAAAEEADLTILGKAGRSLGLRPKMGSTVRTIVARGRGLTLIMQRGVAFEATASVLFTGSALAEKALSIASSLAEVKGMGLLIFLAAASSEELERLRLRAGERTGGRGLATTFRAIPEAALDPVLRAVEAQGPGPVFLPCEPPWLQGERLQSLINRLGNPVFLVRTSPSEG